MSAGGSRNPPVVRAKAAVVNTREYDEARMHARFAAMSAAIHARDEDDLGFNAADVTPRSLSLLTGNLRVFVELALGRNADSAFRKLTKFPHRLFLDYAVDGAVQVMLCTCLRFKATNGLRRLDFLNTDKRALYVDLLRLIEKNLKQARLLPMVKVFIARSVPTSVQPELRAIIQKRAVTVSSASAATHIVYPDPPGTTAATTDGTDYCRALEIKDQLALVHWWYYPDSYDSWIPSADVEGDPEPVEDHEGPWHVQVRWLQDTDLFNEWMNEGDYEIPDDMRIKVIPAPRTESAAQNHAVPTPAPASAPSPADTAIVAAPPRSSKKSSKKRRRPSAASASKTTTPPEREESGAAAREADMEDDEEGAIAEDEIPGGAVEYEGGNSSSKRRADGTSAHRRRDYGASGSERGSRAPRSSDDPEGGNSNKSSGRSRSGRAPRSSGGSDHGAPAAAPEGSREKKRARLSEDGKSSANTVDNKAAGIKIRLNLKAPKDELQAATSTAPAAPGAPKAADAESKDRNSARRSGDQPRVDGNIKVRVKLPKANGGSMNDRKTQDVEEDKHMDGAQGIADNAESKPKLTQPPVAEEGLPEAGDKETVLRNSSKPDEKESDTKAASRRSNKAKKKERRPQTRIPGVTLVDNAVPIPEADVPRIRNISLEGAVEDDLRIGTRHGRHTGERGDGDNLTKRDHDGDVKMEASDVGSATVKREGALKDDGVSTERVKAVSEGVLLGDAAGAAASAADVVEALPPITVRVPAQSRWFRMDAIHDIEKRSVSEFFNNRSASKTPKVYKKYRDFMIEVWRENPDKYLTATAVRRHLAGDVCAILRVHAFLEHWGLINYGTIPESRPHNGLVSGQMPGRARPVHVDNNIPAPARGVPRSLFFGEPQPPRRDNIPASLKSAVVAGKQKSMYPNKTPVMTRRELYATAAAVKYECDACASDCSRMRYHCVGPADLELCPSCFANGVYPDLLSARDFEQLTSVLSSDAYDGTVWSEAEVLLLLEGLEKFGDDWNSVAEHVRTKNNEQCVLQFLRMPIEDSFLTDQVGKWARPQTSIVSSHTDAGRDFDPVSGEHKFAGPLLPFADSANPIMAQVAFLASSVSPEVAAAAAQAALAKIMAEAPLVPPASSVAQKERSDMANSLLTSDSPHVSAGMSRSAHSTAAGSHVSAHAASTGPGTRVSGAAPAAPMQTAPSADPNALDCAAVEAAVAVGLAAAVTRARKLADSEIREIERCFAVAVETKLRAVDIKLKQFEAMERHVRLERERLGKQRQQVYADRIEAAITRTSRGAANVGLVATAPGMPLQHRPVPGLVPAAAAHQLQPPTSMYPSHSLQSQQTGQRPMMPSVSAAAPNAMKD